MGKKQNQPAQEKQRKAVFDAIAAGGTDGHKLMLSRTKMAERARLGQFLLILFGGE